MGSLIYEVYEAHLIGISQAIVIFLKSAFSGTVCARTETTILSELACANALKPASQNLTFGTVSIHLSLPLSLALLDDVFD